jgi:predicted nucleic acid-binding protein
MCIIIDTNVLADVFEKGSKFHSEFEPVYDWINDGKGKIVLGGSKYANELDRTRKYLKILGEFERKNKIVRVNNEKVDAREKEIEKKKRHTDFNDAHLIAIVIESGCMLVCTKDSASVPFIKDKAFYPKSCKKPKIYSGKRNKNLLVDCNIAPICKEKEKKSQDK